VAVMSQRSDHSGKALAAVLLQIRIKHHAHRAHQQAPGRQYGDSITVEPDQAVLGHALKLRPELTEITLKIDVERAFDLGEFEAEIADQLLDHGATQAIIGVTQQATAGGQLRGSQGILVLIQVAAVLAVQVADLTDGRHAQTNQIAMTVGGVALEIALQGRLFLGNRQFIVGQGETAGFGRRRSPHGFPQGFAGD
jgi:hypothetical protein